MRGEHLAIPAVRLVPNGRASAKAPRNWGSNVTLLASMGLSGMGPCVAAVEGATTGAVFEAYLKNVLAPSLRAGQVVVVVVVVMDNLSSHKSSRVRKLIEERGCELLSTCRPTTRRISTPSSRPSPSSRPRCEGRGLGPSRGADRGDGAGAE